MTRRTRIILMIGVALVAWFGITVRWATQPLSDTMRVGKNADLEFVSQRVECGTVFDSDPTGGNPIPVLVTPADVDLTKTPQWAYPRTPCQLVHEQARLLFGINVGVFVVGFALLIVVALRLARRPAPRAVPAAAATT
ncbi:MAG: hypothetical protein GYA65_10695 [Actinobacteria bacterium]|jgi:hypothetical protein|nr:hypothetical protein [Acidimicrobiaceae bacterium]MBP7891002.1 hypothetical protein [Ilumatobacteraceae bacterium]NMD24637.1 hypothetical protein [Actinomycetota bacterium]HAN34646.1 hypothetical protein [Acidimicrobiaceae bacterium]HQY13701.1 hypothetical protein [Ilumatobacteraceae bacterium]